MALIGFLLFGLFVGAVARMLKPGRQHLSLLATLALGAVGSLVGGVVASLFGTGTITELNVLGAVVAIITAYALIETAERLSLEA